MKTVVGNYDKYSIFPQAGEVCTILRPNIDGKPFNNKVLSLPASLVEGMRVDMTQWKSRNYRGV